VGYRVNSLVQVVRVNISRSEECDADCVFYILRYKPQGPRRCLDPIDHSAVDERCGCHVERQVFQLGCGEINNNGEVFGGRMRCC